MRCSTDAVSAPHALCAHARSSMDALVEHLEQISTNESVWLSYMRHRTQVRWWHMHWLAWGVMCAREWCGDAIECRCVCQFAPLGCMAAEVCVAICTCASQDASDLEAWRENYRRNFGVPPCRLASAAVALGEQRRHNTEGVEQSGGLPAIRCAQRGQLTHLINGLTDLGPATTVPRPPSVLPRPLPRLPGSASGRLSASKGRGAGALARQGNGGARG